ncbi:PXPV repeat-containing protein [Paraburkholderia sp. RAU2J]|uniref:PXPV repeat protein n=1 Tax=Paraburkholderia sp. RAU2J TaxID=1938810 RepID=UPI000EB3FC1F|nr:PXPV repeat protein [Paraburkholderia sp. RAU2J]RKT25458.1 PXPV repeat-containing protein [Paraburkholderia sp. RAU2J]
MKRIVTHLLVAAGLAAGACGVARAHTNLNIGLSLGAPVYAQPARVYAAPQPVYYGGWNHRYERSDYYRGDHRYDRGWGHDNRHWGHDNRGDRRSGWHD